MSSAVARAMRTVYEYRNRSDGSQRRVQVGFEGIGLRWNDPGCRIGR